jgi:hypothetical protein
MAGAPKGPLLPPHLDDANLVAYLDGELSRSEMESARAHVETCWTCRSRLGVLLDTIHTFVQTRNALQPDAAADHNQRLRQFRERLARHAAEADSRLTLGDRLREYWGAAVAAVSEHRRVAFATAVAAVILLSMFTDIWNSKVSADTVLARAAEYESNSYPRPGNVTREVVRVDQVDRHTGATKVLGSVTIFRDSLTSAEVISMQSAAGESSARISDPSSAATHSALALLENDLPRPVAVYLESRSWRPDFSVVVFRRLISSRGSPASSVEKQGNLFALHFPFAPGHESGLAEAQLLVEARNYAPVGLSLITANPSVEFRFARTTMATETRSPELARLFTPDIPEKVRTHPAPELHKIVPLSYEGSQASAEEVRLALALHDADACLGEEIHVFPMSDGSPEVQGLVDTAERRDAIRKALHAVDPAAHAQIFLPRELKSGSELFRPPYPIPEPSYGLHPTSAATLADLSSQRIPMYEELYRHFAKPGVSPEEAEKQINAFSSEAVTLARQTFLHAWALKKLDEEFSSRRIHGLSPESLQEIERMRGDHRRWIATLSHRQANMLSLAIQVPARDLHVEPTVQGTPDSDSLIRLAQEQNDLVRSLFTVSSGSADTELALARLLAVLHRMGA